MTESTRDMIDELAARGELESKLAQGVSFMLRVCEHVGRNLGAEFSDLLAVGRESARDRADLEEVRRARIEATSRVDDWRGKGEEHAYRCLRLVLEPVGVDDLFETLWTFVEEAELAGVDDETMRSIFSQAVVADAVPGARQMS